jgi:transcriptional regulator with XRE-family HTH domain
MHSLLLRFRKQQKVEDRVTTMGKRPHLRPQKLAAKLLVIRVKLGLSQLKMAKLLELNLSSSRVSECETGIREQNLLVLLSCAKFAGVPMETFVNDNVNLPA